MNVTRTGVIVLTLPGVLMLSLYYTLALHMHHSLGGWPASIGDRGFSPALLAHAKVTGYVSWMLYLASLLGAPVAIVVSLLRKRWHPGVLYVAIYAGVVVVTFGLMRLAPDPFLNWWDD